MPIFRVKKSPDAGMDIEAETKEKAIEEFLSYASAEPSEVTAKRIFTKEEINKIIDLHGADGKPIDVFNLYGLVYIGNCENGEWNLSKTFIKKNAHSIFIDIEDFEWCRTEEDIEEQFNESLKEAINEKLI